jgi:hypothetical protein
MAPAPVVLGGRHRRRLRSSPASERPAVADEPSPPTGNQVTGRNGSGWDQAGATRRRRAYTYFSMSMASARRWQASNAHRPPGLWA